MENLIKYLSTKLKQNFVSNEAIAKYIAIEIVRRVIDERLEFGTLLPTQGKLAEILELPMSILRLVWNLLSEHYCVIKSNRGGGSVIIASMSENEKLRINKLIERDLEPPVKRLLDNEYVQDFGKERNRELLQVAAANVGFCAAKYNQKIIPELITAFVEDVSRKRGYDFTNKEVSYADDISELITYCAQIYCAKKQDVVVFAPISGVIVNAIGKAKRKITYLVQENADQVLKEFTLRCKANKVGIVYVGPTAPFPSLFERDAAFWQRLHELQKKYHFKFLLDDSFPYNIEIPELFNGIDPGTNTSVISINAKSSYHKYAKLRVIAGCVQDLKKLEKKYEPKGKLVDPSLGYGLLELMKGNKLREYEKEHFQLLDGLVAVAKDLLLASGLFVDEYIHKHQAYFFYLELKSGRLPKNLYKQLKKHHVCFMDPERYQTGPFYKEGILISMANFSHRNSVETTLKYLIEIFRII